MQVEAAAALAPVLARFSIVVHGPLEAEVVGRIVAGGDLAVPLHELARPLGADPGLSRPATVAVVRTVLARLVAGGSVEHVGGGYRLADPGVAATLRGVVDAMGVAASRPLAPTPSPPAATPGAPPALAVAPEEASRLLQSGLVARALPLAVPTVTSPTTPAVPAAWVALVEQGWALDVTGPATGPTLQLPGNGPRHGLHVVVAEPHAPPAVAAGRLATVVPTRLTHLPVAPVRWGEGDPAAARATAPVLGEVLASGGRPVVLDRGLVPALAVLAHEGRTLPTVVVDLRSSIGRPTPVTDGTTGAAGLVAGAAGVAAPARRTALRPRRGRGTPTLLEVLFGARFVEEAGAGAGHGDATDPASHPSPAPSGGVVVTSRTDDPQAEALGELLGVEVVHLRVGDDLAPEVLAFLEDDDGQHVLAPSV